jgi:hypothetical protein
MRHHIITSRLSIFADAFYARIAHSISGQNAEAGVYFADAPGKKFTFKGDGRSLFDPSGLRNGMEPGPDHSA